MGRPYAPRENLGGNFCGHDPQNPRLTLEKPAKTGKGGIPFVLTRLMARLKSYYDNPRQIIPSLNLANGSERQQRSERREACLLLLMALLKYTDLASLRVGIPTQDGFLSLTVDYIGKQTGMAPKRVERALADLKAAGLVTIVQPRKRLPDGSWKGLAAVKAVSRHLFALFGLGGYAETRTHQSQQAVSEKSQEARGCRSGPVDVGFESLGWKTRRETEAHATGRPGISPTTGHQGIGTQTSPPPLDPRAAHRGSRTDAPYPRSVPPLNLRLNCRRAGAKTPRRIDLPLGNQALPHRK